MEAYRPISCDLHDHLEIACLRRLRLQVELTDGTQVEGRALTTVSTPAKEEFLRLESADGVRDLRLDQLHAITALDDETGFGRVVLSA
ncbi:Rof transcriptional antiterminator [Stenotrophomonas maltophilia]|uniref:Rho-binding antiterminator n=1 Tax=Stenotrophomonas chelatiphaga TaxID=517011 RepID=UPI000F4C9145|nr:Rho-binding antiterminator [Stenotrophomonas chelatiphaga]MCS4231327.1 Rho-binding antiterminator [Stenotrophomonas chelatiphaga]ROQ42486.1 Rof transcriptional antiterminator [Stenotrophomonas maltophilia]